MSWGGAPTGPAAPDSPAVLGRGTLLPPFLRAAGHPVRGVTRRRATSCMALAALLASGCVTQQLVIRTNPPGAVVTVDGKTLKDATPVVHPFLWYKTMTIRVEQAGYQPIETQERVWAPWWMIFPLDGLWTILPVPMKDERVFTYTLQRGGGTPPSSTPGATP